MPTVLRMGPYRFFSMRAIVTNRGMCMFNETTGWPNSGWNRYDFSIAAVSAAWNSIAFEV